MGDLEDLDRWQAALNEHRIDLFLDVSGEEEALAPERPEQDDRHVVDGRAAIGGLGGHRAAIGPQDPEPNAVQREVVARRQTAGLRAEQSELRLPCAVAWSRSDHAWLQHRAHPIPREEQRQSADVILVWVGEDDEVEAAIPWRNVRIELNEQPIRVRPTVYEHPPATVALDHDRVALPDVEGDQVDGSVRAVDDDEDQHGDRHGQSAADQSRRRGYSGPAGGPKRRLLQPSGDRTTPDHATADAIMAGSGPANAEGVVAAACRRESTNTIPKAIPCGDREDEASRRDSGRDVRRRLEHYAGEGQRSDRLHDSNHGTQSGPGRQAEDDRDRLWSTQHHGSAGHERQAAGRHRRGDERHDEQVHDRGEEGEPAEPGQNDRQGRGLSCDRDSQ
jgi:hypothetical protein